MPYIDSDGNIVESKQSPLDFLWRFFAFFLYFFKTLFGPLIGETESVLSRGSATRRGRDGGGSNRWPGSGGPGGPPRGDGGNRPGRRPLGRPAFSSGMTCPPMGGGS